MKNYTFSLLGLFPFVSILSAVEPVAFTEVIKATHTEESLEISSFLGETENFEEGKQYKITGTYRTSESHRGDRTTRGGVSNFSDWNQSE
jgi:hypothetical protein